MQLFSIHENKTSSRSWRFKVWNKKLGACQILQLLFGCETKYRIYLSDKLYDDIFSPFMLQFCRSLVSVKKVWLIDLPETSRNQPFRDAHRWIVGIYLWVLDRNGESFYICGIRRTKFLISLLLSGLSTLIRLHPQLTTSSLSPVVSHPSPYITNRITLLRQI